MGLSAWTVEDGVELVAHAAGIIERECDGQTDGLMDATHKQRHTPDYGGA
jgi:hypothetical protein